MERKTRIQRKVVTWRGDFDHHRQKVQRYLDDGWQLSPGTYQAVTEEYAIPFAERGYAVPVRDNVALRTNWIVEVFREVED